MVQKISRRKVPVRDESFIESIQAPLKDRDIRKRRQKSEFMKPEGWREILVVDINESVKDEQLKKVREKRIKKMTENGYDIVEDWYDVTAIFGDQYQPKEHLHAEGRAMFFVWKYSALWNIIEEEEDKQIEIMKQIEEDNFIFDSCEALARKYELYKRMNFIDAVYNKQLSDENGRLNEIKKDGSIIWIPEKKGGITVTYPKRRECTLYDLSYRALKKLLSLVEGRNNKPTQTRKGSKK